MNKLKLVIFLFIGMTIFISCTTNDEKSVEFQSNWTYQNDRYWIGQEYWANRIQDWQINNGRLECLEGNRPLRTVHLLSRSLEERTGTLEMSVETGLISKTNQEDPNSINGFLIAAGNLDLHYKARAQIHNRYGNNAGYLAGIKADGQLVIIDNHDSLKVLPSTVEKKGLVLLNERKFVKLSVFLEPDDDGYSLTLSAFDENENLLTKIKANKIPSEKLTGNIALLSHYGGDKNKSFWFRNWHVSGSKLNIHKDRNWGPVLNVLYTVSRNTLKMTAQFPILGKNDSKSASLEIKESGSTLWTKIAESRLVEPGWTMPFRVEEWNDTLDYDFRICYDLLDTKGEKEKFYYTGKIPKNPKSQDEFVVATFTGNYNGKSIQDWKKGF